MKQVPFAALFKSLHTWLGNAGLLQQIPCLCTVERGIKMSLVGHCAMWGKCYLPFLTSSTLELCSFQAITAPQALLNVNTLGTRADDKEVVGKKQDKGEKARESKRGSVFVSELAVPGESGLIGMQTHLLLSPASPSLRALLKIIHTALGERFNLRFVQFFHREEWRLIFTCMRVPASEILCFPNLQFSVERLKARELKSSSLWWWTGRKKVRLRND